MKYPVKNKEINLEFVKEANRELRLPLLSAAIISARGINEINTAIDYLSNDLNLSDPFQMVDMDAAVDAVLNSVKRNELIVVFGDFDTDGITSTAILRRFFKNISYYNVDHVLPKETEGHGISIDAINRIKDLGAKLIITVDNGTNSKKEILHAKESGIGVIVTDHHLPDGELTKDAIAILNPNREDCSSTFKSYSGGGMALALCVAIARRLGNEKKYITKDLYVLSTISSIADMVPLVGDNRKIIKHGLSNFKSSGIIGLDLLMDKLYMNNSSHMSSRDVAFRIAPLINAAGKFSFADKAIDLLVSTDRGVISSSIKSLLEISSMRRELVSKSFSFLVEEARRQKLEGKSFIFLTGDHPSSINGLLAIRIMESVKLLTFVGSIQENSDIVKVSGRSSDISISSILEETSGIHLGGGGHSFAGGFQIKENDIPQLLKRIENFIDSQRISSNESSFCWEIDSEITSEDITAQVMKSIFLLAPFGKKNEAPIFRMRSVEIKKELVYSKLKSYIETPYGKLKVNFDQQVSKDIENAERLNIIVEINFSSDEPHLLIKDAEII